ncbi:MAG: Gfo/Idh/MocA family protein, partial [Planctomycetia bacterium]
MQLSKEQLVQGRANFQQQSLLLNRRDFLKASAAVPAAGAFAYFGYGALRGSPVRAAIVGTGNEGCQAMIDQSPPDFLEYVAYHDIRPSQIERGRNAFRKLYGPTQGDAVKFYDKWEDLLADKDVEAVVIATPLWTHAKLSIEAMQAGKHVLCEKLMARNITDAKAMVNVAEKTNRLLSIGHQRHYSTLYADALKTVQSGVLGDVKYIQAFWHRNNAWRYPDDYADAKLRGTIRDSWRPEVPEADRSVDVVKYGYKSPEELVRWRLYNRTGGGLMAELGSHQLDACSLFLEGKHPIAVTGVGDKYFYDDDRECEDHVYCTYEFPNGVVVTYSSINTNAVAGYGEIVLGSKGTLMVLTEADVLLYDEPNPFAKKDA